jgi:hypothetical protein
MLQMAHQAFDQWVSSQRHSQDLLIGTERSRIVSDHSIVLSVCLVDVFVASVLNLGPQWELHASTSIALSPN